MRRIQIISAAALLALALAGPVSAAANSTNHSGSADEGYGQWSSFDAGTGIGTYGEAFAGQESGQPGFLKLYEESGKYVDCSAAAPGSPSPKDTGGGQGFQGTRISAFGNLSRTTDSKLTKLTATGSIVVFVDVVDVCALTDIGTEYGNQPFTMRLTGYGSLGTYKDTSSFKMPSQFNGHSSYKITFRQATGTVDFGIDLGSGTGRTFDAAEIDHLTWSDHCNGSGC